MISKNRIKLIRSLETKKGRDKAQLFVAEGRKLVEDLLTAGFVAVDYLEDIEDIKKVSFLQHPQSVLATFPLPANDDCFSLDFTQQELGEETCLDKILNKQLCLALDGVQDPGNLGTIIRIADWFGIEHVFCSKETADCWNPKVVQATMGSIARVKLHYIALDQLLDKLPHDYPIYGTLLDGNNIYEQDLTQHGIIIMGNEGKGISPSLRTKINRRLLIPSYPALHNTAESLNVAIATSIVCAEFRRRSGNK